MDLPVDGSSEMHNPLELSAHFSFSRSTGRRGAQFGIGEELTQKQPNFSIKKLSFRSHLLHRRIAALRVFLISSVVDSVAPILPCPAAKWEGDGFATVQDQSSAKAAPGIENAVKDYGKVSASSSFPIRSADSGMIHRRPKIKTGRSGPQERYPFGL
jgi:hypothetical protein